MTEKKTISDNSAGTTFFQGVLNLFCALCQKIKLTPHRNRLSKSEERVKKNGHCCIMLLFYANMQLLQQCFPTFAKSFQVGREITKKIMRKCSNLLFTLELHGKIQKVRQFRKRQVRGPSSQIQLHRCCKICSVRLLRQGQELVESTHNICT